MAADLYLIEPLPPEEGDHVPHAQSGGRPLTERLIDAGIWLAVAAAVMEGVVHYVNAATFQTDHVDVNAEHTIFTWANSCAILACALAAGLGILFGAPRRGLLLGIALSTAYISIDETVVIHENVTLAILDAFEQSHTWDSILWPIVYLPLLLATGALLLIVGRSAPERGRRCLLVGLGLLGLALLLEVVSAPWSTDRNAMHTLEGGFEETAELAGWILIATGLASIAALPLQRRSRITRLDQSRVK